VNVGLEGLQDIKIVTLHLKTEKKNVVPVSIQKSSKT
jgi:hypothetical protein